MIPNVETSVNNFIVDQIGDVVAAMRSVSDGPPYYMYGHRAEIADRLREKEKSPLGKAKKYPLIALRLDIAEEINGNVLMYNLNVGIFTKTGTGLNAEERMVKTFKPVLYPLYYQFLRAIKTSGLFMWTNTKGQKFPPHTKLDRPFWGTGYTETSTGSGPGSKQQLFDDPVDAIELVNLKLNTIFKPC